MKRIILVLLFLCSIVPVFANNIKAEIVNVSLYFVEGYACISGDNTIFDVSIYSDNVLIGTSKANSYYSYPFETCSSLDKGFRFSLPETIRDEKDHQITIKINDQIIGNGVNYNSKNLFIQERIGADIFDRIIVNHGFISPKAAQNYNHLINGHMFAAFYSGAGAQPINKGVNFDLSPFTGVIVPSPKEKYQVGSGTDTNPDGSPNFTFLQGGEKSFGIYYNSLANAIPNSGVFLGYNYNPHPYVFKNNQSVTVSGYFLQPQKFADVLTSSDDSVVFYYYVLVLEDKTTNKRIWFSADIYQSREPVKYPFSDFAVAFDPNDPVTHSKLIPNSSYLTLCPNADVATSLPFTSEKYFCFTVNRTQISNLIKLLNTNNYANKPSGWKMSENPDDYTLDSFIINIEGWGIAAQAQSRIGISFRDLKIVTKPKVSCDSVSPSNNPTVGTNLDNYEVFANGVKESTSVRFATWSDMGGQDDLVWRDGINMGNGRWKATIDFAKHKDLGQYQTHVYMDGVMCGAANFIRSSSIIGDANNNNLVDLVDFGIWKQEYLKIVNTKNADFNKNDNVDLIDFGLWKSSYLGSN